jgi:IPT/TIG domain
MLHEFGHLLTIPKFIQHDFQNRGAVEFNDALVDTNCRNMIEALPSIASVSPASGPVGTRITITGNNLGGSQGTSTVTFNEQGATPISWSANGSGVTTIVVPVPPNASTGNIVVTVSGVPTTGPVFTVQ